MDEFEAERMISEQDRWQDVKYDNYGNKNTSFPYPPKFVMSEASGELAERIRKAFAGDDEDYRKELEYETVYLTEKTVFGGYSEYTQENFTYLLVRCGRFEEEFAESYNKSLIQALLDWLNEAEDPETEPEEVDLNRW